MKRLANTYIEDKAHLIANQITEFLNEGNLIFDDRTRQGYNETGDMYFITMSFQLWQYDAYEVQLSRRFYKFIDNINYEYDRGVIVNVDSKNDDKFTINIQVYEE